MEIDDGAAARALVEPIDVLSDELGECAGGFPCGKRVMRGIRGRGRESGPPGVCARPVSPVDSILGAERLDQHRGPPLPLAVVVAIVGNARRGAAAGPGQGEYAAMAADPV